VIYLSLLLITMQRRCNIFGDFAVTVSFFQPHTLTVRHWVNWLHMEIKDIAFKTLLECH